MLGFRSARLHVPTHTLLRCDRHQPLLPPSPPLQKFNGYVTTGTPTAPGMKMPAVPARKAASGAEMLESFKAEDEAMKDLLKLNEFDPDSIKKATKSSVPGRRKGDGVPQLWNVRPPVHPHFPRCPLIHLPCVLHLLAQ